jgi:DUF1680 family protein
MPLNKYSPIDYANVEITDEFWAPRIEKVRSVAMPHTFIQLQQTGRIDALKLLWKKGMPNQPHIFWDSDVAKWLESAAILLRTKNDADLSKKLDDVVNLVIAAQQPDGYINSHFTVVNPEKRWTHLRDHHELYCAGHLMEAAAEHYTATKDPKFLTAMSKYTDLIIKTFGREPGKKRGYPGHPEIELALFKMYKVTGDKKYLQLSQYFVDERGADPDYYIEEAIARGEKVQGYMDDMNPNETLLGRPGRSGMYYMNHLPIREMDEVVGHAVRMFYLLTGAADVAIETEDRELLDAMYRLWEDTIKHKMYLTGGIGSARQNEGFEKAYILPNADAYCETCAAIALVFFNHRLLQIDCDGKFADIIERALYNGILSSYSLGGDEFFYENPLAVLPARKGFKRDKWFGCSCCPNNFTRLMGSLGQYMYSVGKNEVAIHQYIQSRTNIPFRSGELVFNQKSKYPWEGDIEIAINGSNSQMFASEMALKLRIPGWCRKYTITVIKTDGSTIKIEPSELDRGYITIIRKWNAGESVRLHLEIPVERVYAHPKVLSNIGRVALQRGPIVYCIEEADNGQNLDGIFLPRTSLIKTEITNQFLPGTVILTMQAEAVSPERMPETLYYIKDQITPLQVKEIIAIPYCFWNNRGAGEMEVWIREK